MDTSILRLSCMRALWGIVTANVRKVSVSCNEMEIYVHFYYDEEPTETEIELSEEAASEVISSFSESFGISCERIVIPSPQKIYFTGYLIYSRYEETYTETT